jgi:hypothetical protein
VVTGEVAVTLGAVGEGMVAGDAVNTASRVQAAAEVLPPAHRIYLLGEVDVCPRSVLARRISAHLAPNGRELSSPTDAAGSARARAQEISVRAADLR